MTLILDLDPAQERELETLARREGLPLTDYALRRLLPSSLTSPPTNGRQFNIMHFAAAAPRSAEEIDAQIAEIEADRDSWDYASAVESSQVRQKNEA